LVELVIVLKQIIDKRDECRLDWTGSDYGPVVNFYKNYNRYSSAVKTKTNYIFQILDFVALILVDENKTHGNQHGVIIARFLAASFTSREFSSHSNVFIVRI
jgi:hypothetical protein